MRWSQLVVCIVTTAALFSAGCKRSAADGKPFSGQEINVLNWGDYIDEELLTEFSQRTGARVVYDRFASDAELEAKMLSGGGGYDVIFPSDRGIAPLIKRDLLSELDRGRLSNWKNLDPAFLGARFDPTNRCSVPYFWGTLAVGIRTDQVKGDVQGFEVLFDPRYKDRITMLDDAESVTAAALLHLKHPMNSTDPAHLAEVKELLLRQRPLVQAYTSDGFKEKLIKGDAWVSLGWNGDLMQAARENANIRVLVPKAGTLIWVDSMAIPRDAPSPDLAYEFVNFLLDPDIAARNANFVKYGTPNLAARAKINKELLDDAAIYPPAEVLKHCQWLLDRGAGIKPIEQLWQEVKQ